jgi:hypothetical protein
VKIKFELFVGCPSNARICIGSSALVCCCQWLPFCDFYGWVGFRHGAHPFLRILMDGLGLECKLTLDMDSILFSDLLSHGDGCHQKFSHR